MKGLLRAITEKPKRYRQVHQYQKENKQERGITGESVIALTVSSVLSHCAPCPIDEVVHKTIINREILNFSVLPSPEQRRKERSVIVLFGNNVLMCQSNKSVK